MQRRDFLRLVACATGTAVFGGTLSSRGAKAAAAKPQKLNLLYATAEADSEAIKLVLPDFASKLGIKLNLETFPYAALQQKVFAELASSSAFYDIMVVDTPWMPALTNKIEPLSSYLKNPQYNAYYRNEVPTDYVYRMGKNLRHIHLSEFGRLPPGAGRGDFVGLVAALRQIDYKGYLTMEIGFNRRDVEPDLVARQAYQYLKPLVSNK